MVLTERQLWYRALARLKATCEQDGVPFAITTDDVLNLKQPTKCPLTDLVLQRSQGHWSACAPTLMLLTVEDGYVPGNIVVVSNLAATIRHTLTDDQMQKLCKRLPQMVDF